MVDKLRITKLFDCWNEEKEQIAILFRKRQKQAASGPMVQQTENFISALYEVNEFNPNNMNNWQADVDKLTITPINLKERLAFVLEKPTNYHSYIQLSELFDELRKQYEKSVVIEALSNKKTR